MSYLNIAALATLHLESSGAASRYAFSLCFICIAVFWLIFLIQMRPSWYDDVKPPQILDDSLLYSIDSSIVPIAWIFLQTRLDPCIAIVLSISIYLSFIAHYSIFHYRFASCSVYCSIFASLRQWKIPLHSLWFDWINLMMNPPQKNSVASARSTGSHQIPHQQRMQQNFALVFHEQYDPSIWALDFHASATPAAILSITSVLPVQRLYITAIVALFFLLKHKAHQAFIKILSQCLIMFLHALRWRMQCFLIIYSGFTDSHWSIHCHRACNQHSLPVQPLYITSIYRSFGAHYSIFNYRFVFNYCCTGGSIFDAFASLRLMKNSIAFSLIWLDQSDDESASEKQCCQCSVHWISSDTSWTKNATEFCVSFRSRIQTLHLSGILSP